MIEKSLSFINAKRNAKLVKLIVLVIVGLIVLMVVGWIYSKMTLNDRNCKTMDSLYKDFPLLSTLNVTNKQFSYNLRDYYIKTAYNCCTAGEYKNDFVNVCALKNCIKQGARCLDFEIYSVNDKPVISVSSVDDFSVKETYNSIPFGSAMGVIADYAFSGSSCPCPGDPLLIHLRIMSNNKKIYSEMADNLYNTLENRLLDKQYSYENQGKNIGSSPLKDFMGKVIVVADKTNALFEDTDLDEYVNIASNSVFMRSLRYYDVKYTPDMQELIDFNKKNMTIAIPDLSATAENPSSSLAMKYGCQMVAMAFQNFDTNMEYYDEFFDNEGSAFVLKPVSLRYIPVTINVPSPPPEEYSYKERSVESDYYSFTI
jgi:hypothetical protein